MIKLISLAQVDYLEAAINEQLERRGYGHINLNAQASKERFNIMGPIFNTTPVMFRRIRVESCGGHIKAKGGVLHVVIPIRLACDHFRGKVKDVGRVSNVDLFEFIAYIPDSTIANITHNVVNT